MIKTGLIQFDYVQQKLKRICKQNISQYALLNRLDDLIFSINRRDSVQYVRAKVVKQETKLYIIKAIIFNEI